MGWGEGAAGWFEGGRGIAAGWFEGGRGIAAGGGCKLAAGDGLACWGLEYEGWDTGTVGCVWNYSNLGKYWEQAILIQLIRVPHTWGWLWAVCCCCSAFLGDDAIWVAGGCWECASPWAGFWFWLASSPFWKTRNIKMYKISFYLKKDIWNPSTCNSASKDLSASCAK